MDEYLEYRNNIKNIVKENYKEKLEKLNIKKMYIAFYDKIKFSKLGDNFIFITDFNNMEESIKKVFYYLNILEKKYKILDIFIFKIDDRTNYTDNFLGSFLCIKKQKYELNKEIYDKVFSQNIKNVKKIKTSIEKFISTKKQYLVDINNISKNSNISNISEFYGKIAKESAKYNKKLTKKVVKNFKVKNNLKCDIDNTNIIRNVFIEKTGLEFIQSNNNKVKLYSEKFRRKSENIKYRKDIYTKNNYTAVFIINIHDIERARMYTEILVDMNICPIVLVHNIKNTICIKNIYDALVITRGNFVGLITDKKMKTNYENIIQFEDTLGDKINEESLKKLFFRDNQSLKPFSNLDNINSIKVLTSTFLNFDGTNYFSGGAERYLIDLHKICKNVGYKLRIYQKANFNFVRKYHDIEVVGISNNKKYKADYNQVIEISRNYNKLALNTTKLNIYSSFLECVRKNVSPSVGISHGVAWDNPDNIYNKNCYDPFDKGWIIDSAQLCNKIISVDTNTANYFQTVDFKLGNKTEVIPNYVDTKEFYPIEKNSKKTIILYPRRLYPPRGLYLLLDIVDRVLEKYDNIEFRLVGKGFDEDLKKIDEKVKRWGTDKIKVYNRPPTEMHKEYKESDITLIPTLYSEGTSLSCLEAMASGNAVIASRIGGLTDLIINNYNGKLIEPNSESLYDAIEDFLSNNELLKKCKYNAIEISKTFSKDKWETNWEKIIKQLSKKTDTINNIPLKLVKIYVKKLDNSKLNMIILQYLMKGYLVYVISPEGKYKQSYGRLQYMDGKDELYCSPDIVLAEKNLKIDLEEDNIQYIDF